MSAKIIDMAKKAKQMQEQYEERKKRQQDVNGAVDQFLALHAINYAHKQDRYLIRSNGEWVFVTPKSMGNRFVVWNDAEFRLALSDEMEKRGLKYTDITYTHAKNVPTDIFNLLSMEGWVQPMPGEHHWLFDLLMISLGGGKAENHDHLEQVILYKYIYPEAFLLPAIVMHGEGGTGKNLLIDKVLKTIFNGQTIACLAAHFIGAFNTMVKGRTAILVNEASNDKVSTSALKDMLHKEYLTINEKNIIPYTIANTPLVFMGSNLADGGVDLDGGDADRRLSVMRAPKGKTLVWWIAHTKGWSMAEAQKWMINTGNKIAGDRDELGKWLNHLLDKWGHIEMPSALHGADYQSLLQIQQKPDDRIIEAVFGDPSFTHITRKDLYDGYRLIMEGHGLARYAIRDRKFNERVKQWLADHAPHIILDRVRFPPSTQVWAWLDPSQQHRVDNRGKYIQDGYREKWVGPEV